MPLLEDILSNEITPESKQHATEEQLRIAAIKMDFDLTGQDLPVRPVATKKIALEINTSNLLQGPGLYKPKLQIIDDTNNTNSGKFSPQEIRSASYQPHKK